jgi:hypothetical protein
MKLKTCKACKEKFEPIRPLQQICSVSCAYNYQKKAFEKKMQKEKVEKKKELMTLSDWLKIAQQVVNKYIRERDKNEMNCISCGKTINGVRHASHYLSAGNNYAVRFNTDNIWVSCYKCNVMLSGNQSEYRIRLIQKIGTKRVEYLESIAKDTVKYTINDLQEIIKEFKQKIKELK